MYMPLPSVFSKSVLWKTFHDGGDNKKTHLFGGSRESVKGVATLPPFKKFKTKNSHETRKG